MNKFVHSIVVSDTHGNRRAIKEIARCFSDTAYLFHLGDYTRDAHLLAAQMKKTTVIAVRGNGDYGSEEPETEIVTIRNQRLLLTHGHLLYVKYGLDRLAYFAAEQQADAVLFGHTHMPYIQKEKNIWFINPGSAGEPRNGEPTVAVLLIGEAGLVPKLFRLSMS